MNANNVYSYILILFLIFTITPVFAEVTSIQTNSDSFYKGEQIEFSGTVESESTGLVTIVIRDTNNEFILLTQAIIDYDNSFQKIIKIDDRFSEQGMYNATGFILNMTKGVTVDFGVYLNGVPPDMNKQTIQNTLDELPITSDNSEKIKIIEPVESIVKEQELNSSRKIADFIDPSKSPQHYIDRYYNEPSYKSWFDRNYPGLTIEEAVGYQEETDSQSKDQELINTQIIPEAQASSIAQTNEALIESADEPPDNSEIAQISLAIAGLGILFGAVYGIKIKVDNNSNQISINKDTIRRRIIQPIIGSNPIEILQTRLAKGEISLEEYDKLRSAIN